VYLLSIDYQPPLTIFLMWPPFRRHHVANVCGARRMSLARTPVSLADRCTCSTLASSATGGARVCNGGF